jgi:hypothetical protein
MNNKLIDIDVVIDQTTQKLIDVLSSSGLTAGIMVLIIGDLLHTLQIQKEDKLMHQQDAGKEESDGME